MLIGGYEMKVFVSYVIKTVEGDITYGNTILDIERKIEDSQDLKKIEADIVTKSGMVEALVLNWKYL